MRYIVINQTKVDWFTKEFDDRDEAIKAAEFWFDRLTRAEKRDRVGFYVLESVNPDEEAEDHYDGNIIMDLQEEWAERGMP